MEAKKQNSLTEIKSLLHQGKNEYAKIKISNFIKKNKLSEEDRVYISECYLWLGNIDRALKILGSPPNLSEIKSQPSSIRLLLMRRADLFHFLGASHTANSIFNIIKEHQSEGDNQFYYHFWLGRLALTRYDFISAQKNFKHSLTYNPTHLMAQLGHADALEGVGKPNDALKTLENIKTSAPKIKAIVEQMKGEYFTKLNLHKHAQKHFSEAFELFKIEHSSKDKVYLLQWWGVSLLEQGRLKEALDKIEKAKTMLMECGTQPTMIIALSYLLNVLNKASYEEKLRLYLDTAYSPYRHILPISETASRFPLHPWIKSKTVSAKFDGVQLVPHEKKIKLIQLSGFKSESDTFLDLDKNYFFKSKKKVKLTTYRARVLRSLLGAGDSGINEYRLCDEVYHSTMWNFNLDLDRLKKLIKEIKILGFKISKSYGSYKLDLSTEILEIVCPTKINIERS